MTKNKSFSQNIHRSGPVAHFIYSSIFSRNSTGPDLSHFWYLKIKVFSQNIHRSGPVAHFIYSVELYSIFSRIFHRSGPVAHFIYSSIFSRNSTGPDLSHFWYLRIKNFFSKYSQVRTWILEYIKCVALLILYILAFFHVIPQVRTCRTFDI